MARERKSAEWVQIGPYRMTRDQVAKLLEFRSEDEGMELWLLDEAAASVALDRNSPCRTVSLEDLSPEAQARYARSQQPETD